MRLVFTAIISLVHIVTARPQIQWVSCHDHVPSVLDASFPDANVSVLPSTLHCGHIVVPMDYSRPLGNDNNISVNFAMYRPRDPKGVLFFCPGGTDAGAVVAWQAALNLNSDFTPSFDGLLDYDLMMMDIRGTYGSNPLNVSFETVAAVFRPPTGLSQYRAIENATKEMFKSWEQNSSPPGIVQFTGTREVVQDYESIRAALGYEKINFLGCSYGSFRAAAYAAKYPCRVNNFALDSVVPHGMDLTAQVKREIAMVNRGLLRADAFCQNNASCAFHHAGKGSVPNAFEIILERAANGSLRSCASEEKSCAQPLSSYEVQAALTGALGGQPDFPNILDAFAAGVTGDGEGFVAPPSSAAAQLASVWALPLLCNDYYIKEPTFAGFKQVLDDSEKVDTFNLSQSQILSLHLICSAYPYPAPPQEILELDARMLFVTADFDASAATELTTFAWNHAPNSTLVVRHGDDHVSFNLPQQESTNITKEFLRTGIVPKAMKDTLIAVYGPQTQRKPPVANPYGVLTGFAAGDVDSA